MVKILVIADDFTGALDTAIQFSKNGIVTCVQTNLELPFSQLSDSAQVLVVDAKSRHLPPEKAYQAVFGIVRRAVQAGVHYIYKKTDSALRGNVGSELQAVLDAAEGRELYFLPAYPQNSRTTQDGVQYYRGIRIEDSVYGKDPFEPIQESSIPSIISRQTPVRTQVVSGRQRIPAGQKGKPVIYICDSGTEEEMAWFGRQIFRLPPPVLLAGCAGFADQLSRILKNEKMWRERRYPIEDILIVSGSLNPITRSQLVYAEERGISSFRLSEDRELKADFAGSRDYYLLVDQIRYTWSQKHVLILETAGWKKTAPQEAADCAAEQDGEDQPSKEETRQRIARAMAEVVSGVLEKKRNYGLVVFGGDTLLEIVNCMYSGEILPQVEIETGIPLSLAQDAGGRKNVIVTKSGGFGEEDVILSICDYLRENLEAGMIL